MHLIGDGISMIQQIIFIIFALLLIGSAAMVVFSRNTVKAALFLVLAFVASAGIWMMLEAEFLSLVLILVYVGAVMTLFLFVVMMLNLEQMPIRDTLKRYLPLGLVIGGLLVAIVVMAIQPKFLSLSSATVTAKGSDYSNVNAIGSVLYTHYVYAFEITAAILLVAIIAAIALAFRGSRPGTKQQRINKQVNTRREDAVKLVDIKPQEKP